MIPLAVISTDAAELRVAQSKCLLQHRVEDRPEITRRAVNDLQNLGSRGLLFQRLTRLGDEPRILYCDDSLRREVLQQRDLLVGERTDFPAVEMKDAKQRGVFAKRHQ